MFLEQRINYFQPNQFTGTTSGAANSPLLGTTQKFQIDRTWPIEEIVLMLNFVVNTGGLTLVASPATPDQFDNILQIVQHVNLATNDGKQPRSVVDSSGVGLLEHASLMGFSLEQSTQLLAAYSQTGSLPAGNYTLVYRIPMVEPWIGEPLRSRFYLPVHTYPQDPVLTLQFQTASNIYSAGNINSVSVEVQLVRRLVTQASEAALAADAKARGLTNLSGYIDWDLIETPFTVAPGISTEQRFPLPIPGEYANIVFRHYLGGSTVARKEIDNGATGTSFGNENRWRLETGQVVQREWRWRHLRTLNDFSRPLNAALMPGGFVASTSAGSPTVQLQGLPLVYGLPAGAIPSGQSFRYSNCVALNFLTDGLSGDNATEMGSCLNCNFPSTNGLKMEVIGTPTNVATNASYLYAIGRRYFGNLAGWSAFS